MTHTILFLAANPGSTDRLALDREARAIQCELERSGHRDGFAFVTRWAAEPLDLLRALRALRPTVVHVAGHGGDGPAHDFVFHAADGRSQPVSAAAIGDALRAAGASVRLVVLSACDSAAHAAALRAHVDCVIGMTGEVGDDAARSFATGFYGALASRESIAAAFHHGCAAIRLDDRREGPADHNLPRLDVRPGIDASRIVLAEPPGVPPGVPSMRAPANHVGQVLGGQVIQIANNTSEQEAEARLRRQAREHQAALDRQYLADPIMQHRHAETAVLRVIAMAIAAIGAIALALGQVALGLPALVAGGAATRILARRRPRGPTSR